MAKPSDLFTWSTDTNFTNGGVGIAGTPTKVAPSAGVKAEGHVPGTKAYAQRVNWLMNVVGQWLTYLDSRFDGSDELVYPTPPTRILRLSPFGIGFDASASIGGDAQPSWVASGSAGFVACLFDSGVLSIGLSNLLPEGSTLTKVRCYVYPHARAGGSRASGSRMQFEVKKHALDWSTPGAPTVTTPVAAVEDNDTDAYQILDSGTISQSITKGTAFWELRVRGGTGNSSSIANDQVFAIELTFTDPGPRNF